MKIIKNLSNILEREISEDNAEYLLNIFERGMALYNLNEEEQDDKISKILSSCQFKKYQQTFKKDNGIQEIVILWARYEDYRITFILEWYADPEENAVDACVYKEMFKVYEKSENLPDMMTYEEFAELMMKEGVYRYDYSDKNMKLDRLDTMYKIARCLAKGLEIQEVESDIINFHKYKMRCVEDSYDIYMKYE